MNEREQMVLDSILEYAEKEAAGNNNCDGVYPVGTVCEVLLKYIRALEKTIAFQGIQAATRRKD